MRAPGPQLFGVIGWPIAHSRSPAMQNAALRALGVEGTYLAFAVRPEALEAAVRGAQALGFRGLNVTIPHKEAALALCRPDPLALQVGAVNTLVFEADGVHGLNTDVHGFRMLLAETGVRPGGRVVLLGAGGAARAVVVALRSAGFFDLTVVTRSGRPLDVAGVRCAGEPWEALPQLLYGCDLLVDATPRGLDPHAPPIDLSPLPEGAAVIDLVVKRETALVQAASARGLKAQAGAPMLLHQGAAALERWLGRPAPIDEMRAALEASLT